MNDELIREVWNKAETIDGLEPDMFRKDPCGAIMAWHHYNKNSSFGWVIDHIFPVSKGGDDNILNLRAMNLANDLSKGNDYPLYFSAMTMGLTDNVKHVKEYRVNEEIQRQLAELYDASNTSLS